MFIRRWLFSTSKALYTIEGACTIIIFTIMVMMLISMISIIRTEVVIQAAINQTAMQLSQYSYAIGSKATFDDDDKVGDLQSILQDANREAVGFTTGSVICKSLTENRIDEKALKIVTGGYDGLNFSASNILGDGKTITVIVIYEVELNTYGLIDKKLQICQKAQTNAWLPYDSDTYGTASSTTSSIWNETNFTRGKYFVEIEKEADPSKGVKSGQGIDLYYSETGKAVEIYSLNVFSPSYSYNSGDVSSPSDYSPNTENLDKLILGYADDFEKDIADTDGSIVMDDGSTCEIDVSVKEIKIVVPTEAQNNESFVNYFASIETTLKSSYGIDLVVVYSEEAL